MIRPLAIQSTITDRAGLPFGDLSSARARRRANGVSQAMPAADAPRRRSVRRDKWAGDPHGPPSMEVSKLGFIQWFQENSVELIRVQYRSPMNAVFFPPAAIPSARRPSK